MARLRASSPAPPAEIHAAGVALAKQVYEVDCPGPVDIAVVSAYPYDIDYYQAIRAIEYGDVLVRPGGSILVVAPCPDGIGSEAFYRLLAAPDQQPDDFLRNIARRNGKVTYNVLGYFLTLIRAEKQIYGLYARHSGARVGSDRDPAGRLAPSGRRCPLASHGPQARLAVLPVGSATIPHLV